MEEENLGATGKQESWRRRDNESYKTGEKGRDNSYLGIREGMVVTCG